MTDIPPPPQAVIDRLFERHADAVRAAFAHVIEKEVRDVRVDRAERP